VESSECSPNGETKAPQVP